MYGSEVTKEELGSLCAKGKFDVNARIVSFKKLIDIMIGNL